MSVGQKQRVSSLRFYLYDRPLHPELFDIYHDANIVKPAYQAQVWVTGCSHVIGLFVQKLSLVEVVAGVDGELPQRGRLLEMPFRGEKDHEVKQAGGVHYMTSFQAETMSPQVYARTHHDLARAARRHGLFVPFPMWMTRGLTPFTYIDYETKATQLHVFAFHALPEDLTVIKTQSIFELA